MGVWTASAPANLVPVHPPLGFHPPFYAPQVTTLVLREHIFSWSGDDFTVVDQNGYGVVKCSAKTLSLRERRVIMDNNGTPLYLIRTKLMALQKTYVAEDPSGRELFRIKKKIMSFGTKMSATFVNAATGNETVVLLRGDFWGGSADLSIENGPMIAQISRDIFNMRQFIYDRQTYFVSVAPGVDLSFIAALCICFDEAKADHNN